MKPASKKLALACALALAMSSCASVAGELAGIEQVSSTATVTAEAAPTTVAAPESTTTTTTEPETFVNAVGKPHGIVEGMLQFRGNPTHTWYGKGPVPTSPTIRWRFGEMCGVTNPGTGPTTKCGTAWTGQPVVYERSDGVTEVIFGAYDHKVHFLDAASGLETRPPFVTGDAIKGSVTLDPDGYPLLYFGSRDNKMRILALDREAPTEVWALNAEDWNGIWNNDWDGNPSVIDDVLYEGGENGIFYAVLLNRAYADDGSVSVDPQVLATVNGWTTELIDLVGRNLSIENSVAIYEDTAYFGNGGGRVVGVDISNVRQGEAPIVFDYWLGDDIDASIVIDDEGMLYVPVEMERFNARSKEVGQLVKLDPSQEDPFVWGVPIPPRVDGDDGGLWATPVLGDEVVYVTTHPGELLAVDAKTGEVLFRDEVGHHAWSSPLLVDDTLVVSINCEAGGGLRFYDVSDPGSPQTISQFDLDSGCIESTPTVWKGSIYVGARDGYFYAFG